MSIFQKLSNEELEIRLKEFVSKERLLLHIILDHIKEVDRRKLYLDKAYPSLFEYLVKELGYSGSAAMRRQEAARLLNEIPDLGHKLQKGSINLSQVGELSKAIRQKEKMNLKRTQDKRSAQLSTTEKSDVIAAIQGKSAAETQQIISKAWDLPVIKNDKEVVQQDRSVRIEVTLTKEQYANLVDCRNQAAHALGQRRQDLSWGSVLEYLADTYLKKNQKKNTSMKGKKPDVIDSQAVRFHSDAVSGYTHHSASCDASTSGMNTTSQANNFSEKDSSVIANKFSRTDDSVGTHMSPGIDFSTQDNASQKLTAQRKNEIKRKDLCCQFKNPQTGKICGSKLALEVDHKVPQWSVGLHSLKDFIHHPDNLQVLCSIHNRYKYKKESHIH